MVQFSQFPLIIVPIGIWSCPECWVLIEGNRKWITFTCCIFMFRHFCVLVRCLKLFKLSLCFTFLFCLHWVYWRLLYFLNWYVWFWSVSWIWVQWIFNDVMMRLCTFVWFFYLYSFLGYFYWFCLAKLWFLKSFFCKISVKNYIVIILRDIFNKPIMLFEKTN